MQACRLPAVNYVCARGSKTSRPALVLGALSGSAPADGDYCGVTSWHSGSTGAGSPLAFNNLQETSS